MGWTPQLVERLIASAEYTCPYCDGHHVEQGMVRVAKRRAYQELSCDCGARWVDEYTLSRIVFLRG